MGSKVFQYDPTNSLSTGIAGYWKLYQLVDQQNYINSTPDLISGNTFSWDSVGGTPTYTTGKVGGGNGAIVFNTPPASNKYVQASNSTFSWERTQAFSINCWMYRIGTATNKVMFGKKLSTGNLTGFWFVQKSDDKVYLELVNTTTTNILSVSTSSTYTGLNAWEMWTVTYDGSSTPGGITIYRNGNAVSMSTVYDTLSATIITSNVATIGGIPGLSQNAYNFYGNLDELGVWTKALSATEVSALYNNGNGQTMIESLVTAKQFSVDTFNSLTWGLVGCWSGSTVDLSGNNDLTNNNVTYGTGKVRPSFVFDSTTDYMSLASSSIFNWEASQPLTFAAWVYLNALGLRMFIQKYENDADPRGWAIYQTNQTGFVNYMWFRMRSDSTHDLIASAGAGATFPLSQWKHIIWTYSGNGGPSGTRFYIDNVSQTMGAPSNSLAGATILNSITPKIGNWDGSTNFNGQMSDIFLWNREITPTERGDVYNSGKGNPTYRLSSHIPGRPVQFL